MYRTLLLIVLYGFSFICHAQSLQDIWQAFYQQAWQSSPIYIDQQKLSQYPQQLLLEKASYPDFDKYTWADLKSLYKLAKSCESRAMISARLHDATEFELALCHGSVLNISWFSQHQLLHPAGGSYADRYIEKYPNRISDSALLKYVTIANPLHPLSKQLSNISISGREALFSGYRAWMDNGTLWLSGEQGWKKVKASTWQPIAKKLSLTLTSSSCMFRYSNLCISKVTDNSRLSRIIFLFLLLFLSVFFLRTLFEKRKQKQEKQFILQLLTHELRTPITSLGLTLEMFRNEFDDLSEPCQDMFWRLVSDHQRLSQLTENSKTYLNADSSNTLIKQTAYLDEWLEYICAKHNVRYVLDTNVELTIPFYWLSICLDNLLRNAKRHGKGEIIVFVKVTDKLMIEVQDEGVYPSWFNLCLRRYYKHTDSENMGVGLSIVTHLITLMSGRFYVKRNPTRCTLELPL